MTRQRRRRLRVLISSIALCAVAFAACGDDADDVTTGGTGDRRPNTSSDVTPTAPPESEPTYSGEVTSVSAFEPITEDCVDASDLDPDGSISSDDPPICTDVANTTVGHILVEEVPGAQTGDKISLRLETHTPIFRDGDDGPVAIEFADVAEGDIVDVWVDGPVADSYPQQGSPDVIVVRP